MTEFSPDEKWFAVCKDWDVALENAETNEKIQVTTEGHRKFRYGTANWTYWEEIGVRHGMWWTTMSIPPMPGNSSTLWTRPKNLMRVVFSPVPDMVSMETIRNGSFSIVISLHPMKNDV